MTQELAPEDGNAYRRVWRAFYACCGGERDDYRVVSLETIYPDCVIYSVTRGPHQEAFRRRYAISQTGDVIFDRSVELMS